MPNTDICFCIYKNRLLIDACTEIGIWQIYNNKINQQRNNTKLKIYF